VKPPTYPFAALVGLEALKLALQLAAIDHRLSVLIKGDKGAAKSTAARGLADLLDRDAPFITLPIGATDDRLLGGLDIEKALKGEPALKRGLLAGAHGGVLYVDEVNLLPDHLADAVLDAVASGVHVVEREGFSASQQADFVLLGTMNPEEGSLRPQLLDRFALSVEVEATFDPRERRAIVERRLQYDANPAGFVDEWRNEQELQATRLADARVAVGVVSISPEILDLISERVVQQQVRSLRADLAVIRASRAAAALDRSLAVTIDHVDLVWPLAVGHRAARLSQPPNPPPTSPPPQRDREDRANHGGGATSERVFPVAPIAAPRLVVDHSGVERGNTARSDRAQTGVPTGARQATEPRELDVRATVQQSIVRTGNVTIAREDLHERVRAPQAGTRFVFVIDSSGSHAVHDRMRFVKGAVRALIDGAAGRRDELALVIARGAEAQLLVSPTTDASAIERAIEYVPTGGRTPLAHALELTAGLVNDATVAIVVTDGHANVPLRGHDAWADALAAASTIRCPAVVIDSEDEQHATGRPRALAEQMSATYLRLDELDATGAVVVLRGKR
jgi:magnesium chelatase subunit D